MSNQNETEKQAINDVIDAWAREENANANGKPLPAPEEPKNKTALQKAVDAWAAEKSNS